MDGVNRSHAALGVSDVCIAKYPGDWAQALVALDARVELLGKGGPKVMRFADLHRLPGDRPDRETTLEPGDLVTSLGSRLIHSLKVTTATIDMAER